MTDSMKFGPEWLRNMSADTTTNPGFTSVGNSLSSNSSNNAITITSTTNSSNSSNSSNVGGAHNNNSNSEPSNLNTPSVRNMLSEFRYGREEMLSLFDRNCNLPDILPAYKTLFIEKVQYPLAMTPSTDEEMIAQSPVIATQRPTWIQRSPVGFGSPSRGTGRGGGSADRGRMRGKTVYHPLYQRPTAMFEDDLRSPSSKPERGWSERNGASDALGGSNNITGGGAGTGIGALSAEWNGSPTSSPRKEFSSHSRNMENWRRNRNEDGNAPVSGGNNVPTNSDGWRGSSSATSFGGTHRWGRSTSWRDDDLSGVGNEGSGGYIGASGISMQRSYSTIATSVGERISGGVYGNNMSKNPHNAANFASIGNIGRAPNTMTTRINQWQGTNSSGGSGLTDVEDNLPEWAMENSADGGGTFDASGAFHGSSADEYEIMPASAAATDTINKGHYKAGRKQSTDSENSSNNNNEVKSDPLLKKEETKSNRENKNESTGESVVADSETKVADATIIEHARKITPTTTTNNDIQENISNEKKQNELPQHQTAANNINNSVLLKPKKAASASYETAHHNKNNSKNSHNNNNNKDFSDHMKEVADDMVEKLIMDDDINGSESKTNATIINSSSLSSSTTAPSVTAAAMRVDGTFAAAMLKQHHPASTVPTQTTVSISPTNTLATTMAGGGAGSSGTNTGAAHKNSISLYGGAGGVVDHATMQQQQHHLHQQLATAAATAACLPHSPSGDLWFYRDPQSKVQGPFTAIEMTEWYRAGYFDENLLVRRVVDTRYRALGELMKFCNGNMPFTNSHLIPLSVESIHQRPNAMPASVGIMLSDFGLNKSLLPQHEQREELKCNVTAAANALSAAIKNTISPVDISHMLHMHFQMLQQDYYRQQKRAIIGELSKNERFQRLNPAEQEAIVREKVQMLVLPEYLTNLNGLSQTLASLNPTAGNQLYDAIAECTKKEQLFAGGAALQQQNTVNTFLDADNLLMNPQQLHSPFASSASGRYDAGLSSEAVGKPELAADLLSEFNLRMILRNSVDAEHMQQQQQEAPDFVSANITNPNEFLSEQQLLAATAAQSSMMQMWLPQLGAATNAAHQQHQQITQANGQWAAGGPLVGIPSAVMAAGGNNLVRPQPKSTTTANTSLMWDDVTMLQQQNAQNEQQIRLDANLVHFDEHQKLQVLLQQQRGSATVATTQQQHLRKETHHNLSEMQTETLAENSQQILQVAEEAAATQSSATNKQSKDDLMNEKPQHLNKRSNNKQGTIKVIKDEIAIVTQATATAVNATGNSGSSNNKKSEEERRRELAEEKRRQKEEKKRQQMEDEKRRLQQAEDEKRRQLQEEKERLQQIQAQRRKALLGNNSSSNNSVNNSAAAQTNNTTTTITSKTSKIQTSIAPWSTQSNAKSGPPCLAEIQKAERRERRADQQRQMELLEKQMRATALEANDAILKWNPSPLPVKSFAEIQAEEAKLLAVEQLEIQRRKEYEQLQQPIMATTTMANSSFASASVNNIWGSTRFWETAAAAPGSKFGAAPMNLNSNTTSAAIVAAAGLISSGNKQQITAQQKITPTTSSANNNNNQALSGASVITARNLRKSQTVSVMQNTTAAATATNNKNSKSNLQQNVAGYKQKLTLQAKQQQPNGIASSSNYSNNKKDDLENEFTGWCTKSLNNMNTKVDVPTFVTFLQDLESPYEVKDYIRMYLGENKEFTEFAKQFLERRSKYKNQQRAQNAHNDDMCKPAPAITPSGNDNADNKGKPKKIKKNKMTKLDARILGFSVTAAEGRINVGSRDYVDGP